MTAVELLTEKLRIEFGFAFSNNILKQAKELEKQQIKDCWKKAQDEQRKEFSSSYCSINFEEYYNETFKTK